MRCIQLLLMTLVLYFHVQAANTQVYSTHKITDNITIDGNLDEAAWVTAKWESNFKMYYPYDNKPASQITGFAILYDRDFIYVAIRAYDSLPEKIVRRLTRRDDLDGDQMGIQFDSYFDKQTCYEFMVSAAGTKSDKFISGDGEIEDETWDAIWWARTSMVSDGWIVEMKIPFSQLRFVNNPVQTWGIQVGRYIQRNEELSFWAPIKRDDPGWVHHFAEMDGISDIEPQKVFDLFPYAVGCAETYEKEEGNPFSDGQDWNGNAGLDGKIGLTNNLTLDFTVNPDFGQVEADPSTVNLSGFELFFDERRPFFVEGSNIIDFALMLNNGDLGSENLFYSRRIGRSPNHYPDLQDDDQRTEYANVPRFTRIIGAGKVSGRTDNGLSIGVLESVTAKETAQIKGSDNTERTEAVEPITNYSVVSLQKDFDKGNTLLGGMVTSVNRGIHDESLDFLHHNAYTGGINFTKYWKDKTWYIASKADFSYVEGSTEAITNTQESSVHYYQRTDATHIKLDTTRTSLSGYGGNIMLGKSGGGRIRFLSALFFKSPGLETNDIGYVRHSDENLQLIWLGYRINEPFSIFKELNMDFNQWSGLDYEGNWLYYGGNVNFSCTFTNNYNYAMGSNLNGPENSTTHLRGGPLYKLPGTADGWFWVGSDSRKMIYVEAYAYYNDGFGNRSEYKSASGGFTLKPFRFISLSVYGGLSQNFNEQQYVSDAGYASDTRYIMGTLHQKVYNLSLRLNCNITPDISLQYWGQPFVATGEYNQFKYAGLTRSKTYDERFIVYTENQIIYNNDDKVYYVDEDHNGVLDYSFDSPDFNAKVFLSNMVFRWEYRPGSVLFLVWSQSRENYDIYTDYTLRSNIENTFNFQANNTFLLKLSYRIGV